MLQARIALGAAVLALAGCASMNSVTSEVASYGEWPTGRAPGTYAIERLPSQKAHESELGLLEPGARHALEQAGFKPAADAADADVVVQLGGRMTRTDYVPWEDPLWWRWGPHYWHRPGYYWRPGWAWPPQYDTQYDQEVALLIRDRRTSTPLYEAHATNASSMRPSQAVVDAMFQAAMKDFPNAVPKAHRISVSLTPAEKQ